MRDKTLKGHVNESRKSPVKAVLRKDTASDDDTAIYANFDKSGTSNERIRLTKIDSFSRNNTQQETHKKKETTVHRSRKLETPPSSLGRSTDKVKSLKRNENTNTPENNRNKNSAAQINKAEKLQISDNQLQKINIESYDTKKSNDSTKSKYLYNVYNNSKEDKKIRTSEQDSTKSIIKDAKISGSSPRKNKMNEVRSADDSETNNIDTKHRKSQISTDKTNTRIEAVKIIPKVENSMIDKNITSRDARPRNGSKSRKSEYVINYDDKNGTVSSVRKLRSGSDSPRRKKTNKEVVKEKFKENLNHKTPDKAALRK